MAGEEDGQGKHDGPSKFESKLQEAAFTFIIVPVFYLVAVTLVSLWASGYFEGLAKGIIFWLIEGVGLVAGLLVYLKKRLEETRW